MQRSKAVRQDSIEEESKPDAEETDGGVNILSGAEDSDAGVSRDAESCMVGVEENEMMQEQPLDVEEAHKNDECGTADKAEASTATSPDASDSDGPLMRPSATVPAKPRARGKMWTWTPVFSDSSDEAEKEGDAIVRHASAPSIYKNSKRG